VSEPNYVDLAWIDPEGKRQHDPLQLKDLADVIRGIENEGGQVRAVFAIDPTDPAAVPRRTDRPLISRIPSREHRQDVR
jgi:hypothetical protein